MQLAEARRPISRPGAAALPQAHLIDPADYASAKALEAEQQRIFRRAWHLAVLARDIPNDKDYVRRPIGQTDLVIQRYQGRIVAYANVCPHRFAAFFDQPSGNSPIRCPYHLWTFDGDGKAIGVPHRQDESLACYQTPELRLDTWQAELVGEFVFVSADPQDSLADFLGPLLPVLRQLSQAAGVERPRVTQDIAADWKVVLQNTVEFEHAFSVHAETFATAMQKPLQLEHDPEADNSISYVTRMDPARHARARDARIDAIFRRVEVPYPDGYRHHLIFPSTTIGYTDNRQLAIMDYQPTGPGSCRMYARLFEFRVPELTAAEAAMLAIVGPWHVGYTEKLFAEDRSICEAVQRGLASRPLHMHGALQPGERLVRRFQQIYRRWMD